MVPGSIEQRAGRAHREAAFRHERPPLACYANYFEVGHNAFEFLLDAGQVEPISGDIQLLSRIAVSPVHAKLLAHLLNQSIAQFEQAHQEIPDLSAAAGQPDLVLTNPYEFERLAMDARRKPAPGEPGNAEPAKRG